MRKLFVDKVEKCENYKCERHKCEESVTLCIVCLHESFVHLCDRTENRCMFVLIVTFAANLTSRDNESYDDRQPENEGEREYLRNAVNYNVKINKYMEKGEENGKFVDTLNHSINTFRNRNKRKGHQGKPSAKQTTTKNSLNQSFPPHSHFPRRTNRIHRISLTTFGA